MKEDRNNTGIRTDRCMSASEIQIAAANYREVKRVAEEKFDPNSKFDRFHMMVDWILLGIGVGYLLLVTILTLIG